MEEVVKLPRTPDFVLVVVVKAGAAARRALTTSNHLPSQTVLASTKSSYILMYLSAGLYTARRRRLSMFSGKHVDKKLPNPLPPPAPPLVPSVPSLGFSARHVLVSPN